MRTIVVLLAFISACAEPPAVRARTPEWADRRTEKRLQSPVALYKTAERTIVYGRNDSRVWHGTDVEVAAGVVRWRPCDESGACAANVETAPIDDFLGVAEMPDSNVKQLRFRAGCPTDKHLAFVASQAR
jgi:hypothetical protein